MFGNVDVEFDFTTGFVVGFEHQAVNFDFIPEEEHVQGITIYFGIFSVSFVFPL